jgi:hypothetical protein
MTIVDKPDAERTGGRTVYHPIPKAMADVEQLIRKINALDPAGREWVLRFAAAQVAEALAASNGRPTGADR